MGTEEGIRKLLERIFGGMDTEMNKIVDDLTMSPSDKFGSDFWTSLLTVCANVFVPIALTLLCFFIASEFYESYVKSNGEVDLQIVSTTAIKCILPIFIVARSYDLIEFTYEEINQIISNLAHEFTVENGNGIDVVDGLMEQVNDMNFWEKMGMWFELQFLFLGINIMKVVTWVIVYGRLFELMLFWLVSPVPISTLMHGEHGQVGKNFLKMFMALIFQGVLIFLCVIIYSKLAQETITSDISSAGWSMLFYSAILVACIVKSGTMAKRMFGTF